MSETNTKVRKKRKKKEPKLKGIIASGVIYIGDAQFFAGSPQLELDPLTGQTMDVTPVDPLNPLNTIDRIMDLAGETETALEIKPYITGRGVLINTHLQQGSYVVKKRKKGGKVVGYTIDLIT